MSRGSHGLREPLSGRLHAPVSADVAASAYTKLFDTHNQPKQLSSSLQQMRLRCTLIGLQVWSGKAFRIWHIESSTGL